MQPPKPKREQISEITTRAKRILGPEVKKEKFEVASLVYSCQPEALSRLLLRVARGTPHRLAAASPRAARGLGLTFRSPCVAASLHFCCFGCGLHFALCAFESITFLVASVRP